MDKSDESIRNSQVPLPTTATIDIFDGCQLECPICPTGMKAGGRKPARMYINLFRAVLDQLPQLQTVYLFNWGEPLMHPQLCLFLNELAKRNVHSVVHSNLSFRKSPEFFMELVESGVNELFVAIDGASQETYGKYRRRGQLSLIIDNINAINSAKAKLWVSTPSITWKFIVNRQNEHERELAKAMAADLGVDIVFDDMGLGQDLRDWKPNGTLQERMEKWLPLDKSLWAPAMRDGHFESYLDDYADIENRRCSSLWNNIVIDPRGNIYPCCLVTQPANAFGNVNQNAVMDIWNGSSYRHARNVFAKQHVATDSNMHIICDTCHMRIRLGILS